MQKETDQSSKALELRFFELLGLTFVVTEKESFRMASGTSNQIDKRLALNLSPLARLLPPDQGMPLISVPFFITVKEMLTWFHQHLVELS